MRWKPRGSTCRRTRRDELRRGQGHGLLTRCVGTAVVGVAEPDLPRVEGEEPLVGDGDPMRVPTDVIEHLVGPGEGWLGVDHPVGLPGGLEMGGKVLPIVEGRRVCRRSATGRSRTPRTRRRAAAGERAGRAPGPGGRTRGGTTPTAYHRARVPRRGPRSGGGDDAPGSGPRCGAPQRTRSGRPDDGDSAAMVRNVSATARKRRP